MNDLLVIDGHNYLYRAYYGIPKAVILPDGRSGNAVYGFFAFLRRMVTWTQPDRIVVVFDSETGILDKQCEVEGYKQGRREPDVEMFAQLSVIEELLRICNIPVIESPNYEADDVIGTIVSNSKTKGTTNYISSGDHDFYQLIAPTVMVVKENQGKLVVMDTAEIKRKFNILPSQYLDYLVLKGDSSDNIPGVRGIGPKTAQYLLNHYNDIDSLFTSLSDLPANIYSKLNGHQGNLVRSREFLTIKKDIPLSPWIKKLHSTPNFFLLQSKTNEIFEKAIDFLSDI